MKLLYMITLPDLGGAQTNVLDLIQGFRTKHDVSFATSAEGPLTHSVRNLGIPVYLVPALGRAINPFSDIRAVQQCIDLVNTIKPDVIHLHSSKAGLIGRIAGYRIGVPVVFTAHGWGFTPGVPSFLRRLVVWFSEALSAPLAKRILCVSSYDDQIAKKYFVGSSRQRVMIHYGLPDNELLAIPESHPVKIMMTARFQEQKDQALLLRAFARIHHHNEFVQLIFVGAGPYLQSCKDLAQTLGISSKVEFWGDRTDVPSLLTNAQIFVLLSRYEGLPISILEAMRAGLPVIASSVNGTPEEVDHNKTGFLVPRGDVAAVANALKILINDPKLRKAMGTAGRVKFLREFTVERMLAQTETVYEQIISER